MWGNGEVRRHRSHPSFHSFPRTGSPGRVLRDTSEHLRDVAFHLSRLYSLPSVLRGFDSLGAKLLPLLLPSTDQLSR